VEIREIYCSDNDLLIRGHMKPNPFERLTPEQSDFLELFVQARGNMRQMEKTLGLSYPTVRNRIETIAAVLREGRSDVPMPVTLSSDEGEE
jgi:hypothetical protein